MRQTIVNLALPIVNAIIDEMLLADPMGPSRQVLGTDASRERLVAFVTSRMPARYTTINETDVVSFTVPMSCYSGEQHYQIRQLVDQGIQTLLQETVFDEACPAGAASGSAGPSTWFG